MKTIVIYTSQTGFTKRYAEWIAERMNADILDLKEAKKKPDSFFGGYDAIVYGGWCLAGKVAKSTWFLGKAPGWKGKKLAVFAVGCSPDGTPEVAESLKQLLTDEQRQYIKAFYCQGGINYERMSFPYRMAMKMFANSLKNKKNATAKDKEMGEFIAQNHDLADIRFIEPIIAYLEA